MPQGFQTVLINPSAFTVQRMLVPPVNVKELAVLQQALTAEQMTKTDLSQALASLSEAVKTGSADSYKKLTIVAEKLATLQQKSPKRYEGIVSQTMTLLGGTSRFGDHKKMIATLRRVLKQREPIDASEEATLRKVTVGKVSSEKVGLPNFDHRAQKLTAAFEVSVAKNPKWKQGLPAFIYAEDTLEIGKSFMMGKLVAITCSISLGETRELAIKVGKVINVKIKEANAGPFLAVTIIGRDGTIEEEPLYYPDQVWIFEHNEEASLWPQVPPLTPSESLVAKAVSVKPEYLDVSWGTIPGRMSNKAALMNRHFSMELLNDYARQERDKRHKKILAVLTSEKIHATVKVKEVIELKNTASLVGQFVVGTNVYWSRWGQDPELYVGQFSGRIIRLESRYLSDSGPLYFKLFLLTRQGMKEVLMPAEDFVQSALVVEARH